MREFITSLHSTRTKKSSLKYIGAEQTPLRRGVATPDYNYIPVGGGEGLENWRLVPCTVKTRVSD